MSEDLFSITIIMILLILFLFSIFKLYVNYFSGIKHIQLERKALFLAKKIFMDNDGVISDIDSILEIANNKIKIVVTDLDTDEFFSNGEAEGQISVRSILVLMDDTPVRVDVYVGSN